MGTWDNISTNWQYVLPPSRPNDSELKRIKEFICDYSINEPVAVLGSTIEYRDLLYSMGFKKVYVFEKNISFHNSLNSWKIYPNDNEIIIEGDWIDTIPQYCSFFNFCLSDLTMGNISYDNRKTFYSSISNSLKFGGIFLDKVLTNEIPLITIDQIYNKYNNLTVNLKSINDFSCEALFCSTMLNDGIVNTSDIYMKLNKLFINNHRLLKFVEKAHLITPENCIWYYGKPWNELKDEYFSFFARSISFDDIADSPYYKRAKHFINYK